MIYTIINKITSKVLLTLVLVLGVSTTMLADGSKDLYPSGVSGHRAMLLGKGYTSPEAIPFPNAGAHYVYARVGEIITMASSAQGTDSKDRRGNYNDKNGGITLYNPSGNIVIDNNQIQGQILNRSAEIAGPRLSASSQGGYTPIYYTVPKGGEGLYRVEFTSRSSTGNGPVLQADNSWTQGNDAAIRAWDVSVINEKNTEFIPGRVYTTNLNFSNGNFNGEYADVSFQGRFFIRTNGGFTYRVKHNGTSGIVWAFFVNNKGFVDKATGNALYKSMNSEASGVRDQIHNPNSPDNASNITHKIYYTLPAEDMPNKAKVAINSSSYGLTTWLNPRVEEPEVENVKVIGAEGTPGIFGHKGGYIEFDAPVAGQQYTIEIVVNGTVFKALEGSTTEGHNKVYWNGIGANGTRLQGTVPVDLKIQLQGAEVHFPFFDMEYNIGGIIIELLNYNNLNGPVISDIVFWDDSDITEGFWSKDLWNRDVWNGYTVGDKVNPIKNTHLILGNKGISSNINGHKWGANGTGAIGTFGDKKSMDTWTFRIGNKKEVPTEVIIKNADLYTTLTYKVEGQIGKGSGNKGNNIEYTIVAGNKGPSDIIADIPNGIHGAPFSFTVPPGVDVTNPGSVQATFSCTNGTAKESIALTYDAVTRTFRSELQIPNGCTVTYKITGKLNGMTGSMIAESTIMRPADVSDPDATNGDPNVRPTNPHYECYNNDSTNLPGGSGAIGCNNIQEAVFMALGECVDKILYFEDFDRGYWNVNSGRTDWNQRASISIGDHGEILRNTDGSIRRDGPMGGATASYLFAPGVNDSRYAAANRYPHSETISVARIKNGYYSVNPPGYVQMGIPATDSWSEGIWMENAPSNDPNIANSNFDWTPAWDNAKAIRDMSGAVNGSAFLVRGAASAAQSIKPFYEFELAEKIEKDRVYTLDLYSYVTYHDKDYMIMDVLDKETGHIYASVPLKYGGVGLPEGAKPEGFSLGWVPLTASFTFAEAACDDVLNKNVKIAIRGSQDRALETGKGFGHTLIDNITFSKRIQDPRCGIHVSNITCADECYQDIIGKGFGWGYFAGELDGKKVVDESFTQPGTDGGFVLDIYELDNSFNMIINGVSLHTEELEFQGSDGLIQNVRFKDGGVWGNGIIKNIWEFHQNGDFDLNDRFNNPVPTIRVVIDKWGNVKLYGKRTEGSSLEELEVFNKITKETVQLSSVAWNKSSDFSANKIRVTQNVVNVTRMYGFGYGQQQKECETCTIEKEGIFKDENQNSFAEEGETILYTFDVKNAGDMDIYDIEIVDPLFGFTIKLDEKTHLPIRKDVSFKGDKNGDGVLNRNETWTFTVSYQVTQNDIYINQGVYNRATVTGVGKLPKSEREIKEESTDPTPYKSGDKGWDPERPFHTYVPLEGSGLLITNPMIYQKMK